MARDVLLWHQCIRGFMMMCYISLRFTYFTYLHTWYSLWDSWHRLSWFELYFHNHQLSVRCNL